MGRYNIPPLHPAEMIFSIWKDTFPEPVVTIRPSGKVELHRDFMQYSVTVFVEQPGEPIEVTDAQYATMQRLIDYGLYRNATMEIYFINSSTLWGREAKNFDGMDFHEAMEARLD